MAHVPPARASMLVSRAPRGERRTNMGDVVFFTGFPGFLGKRIAGPLLADPGTDEVVFLVQDRFKPQAEDALKKLRETFPGKAKATLLVGDIGAPGLGLDLP